jgi:hypothetical protein
MVEIEEGLKSILEKEGSSKPISSSQSSNLNLSSLGIYVIGSFGIGLARVKGANIKNDVNENEDLVNMFLNAAGTFIKSTFNNATLESFDLRKDLTKIRLYFKNFSINTKTFSVVIISRGNVGNINLDDAFKQIKYLMTDKGWYNHIDSNKPMPDYLRMQIEDRLEKLLSCVYKK